jgi:Crinkler effector protein N-terminal domain
MAPSHFLTWSRKGNRPADSAPPLVESSIRIFTLFCWILGVSNDPSSVDIEDYRTVDHLKRVIVKENPVTFAAIDAYQLTLWKVSSFLRFD